MSLEGRVSVVTGGGSGIGAAVAERLADDGSKIAVWDINAAGAATTVERVTGKGGVAAAFEVDVAEPEQVHAAAEATASQLGVPTILVNCAGIRDIGPVLELKPEAWRRVMAVNLDGVLYCTIEVGRMMAHAGGGRIVNFASVAGLAAFPDRTAYVTSKTGVIGLTRSTALDLAKHGIRVNAIAPGHVLTPLTEPFANDPQRLASIRSTPLARWAQPSEMADVVAFLVSDASSYLTGTVIPADGGITIAGR